MSGGDQKACLTHRCHEAAEIINEWVLKDKESTAQPVNGDDVGLECYALVPGQ